MKYELIGKNEASLGQIFENRNIPIGNIMGVNSTAVIDPTRLKNMDKAVELVKRHIDNQSLIYIQQDPDADGVTSTALLALYLKKAHPEVSDRLYIGVQEGKQHGFDRNNILTLEEQIGATFDLVIAPDASSNEHELHKELSEGGRDVLVLDHHDADSYSPYATMVNPQLDDYPNKNISGVGVVMKFAQLYDIKFGFDHSSDYYDLVAVGIIGDMIEITTPETVYMIQRGMSQVKTPFLKALYAKQAYSMKNSITPIGISFYVVPLINGMVRAGTQDEKLLMLQASIADEDFDVPSTKRGNKPGDTETICDQAVRIMTNVKSRQGREVDKAIAVIEDTIETNKLNENQLIVVNAEHAFDKGYTGLIANKIMAKYQKPTLIGSVSRGALAGSGRSYDKSSLPDLKSFLQDSGIVNYAEGHGAAHGFSVDEVRIPELLEYSNRELADLDFTPKYLVDFEIDFAEIDGDMMEFLKEIVNLSKYWAKGFDEPYFVIKNLPVGKDDIEIAGDFDSHFIKIKKGALEYLKFRVETKDIQPFLENGLTRINLVGRVAENEFQGKKSLQVFMEDFEVAGSQAFYF